MLQEKYREKNKELHMVFEDLEKAYDRVPRELIWWSLRKKRVTEAYIKIIQDMYEDCETQVTTREGNTEIHTEIARQYQHVMSAINAESLAFASYNCDGVTSSTSFINNLLSMHTGNLVIRS